MSASTSSSGSDSDGEDRCEPQSKGIDGSAEELDEKESRFVMTAANSQRGRPRGGQRRHTESIDQVKKRALCTACQHFGHWHNDKDKDGKSIGSLHGRDRDEGAPPKKERSVSSLSARLTATVTGAVGTSSPCPTGL